jgi:histidine ammonia-lyase
MPDAETVELDGFGLTQAEVVAVARQGTPVRLSAAALKRMRATRAVVERLARGGEPVYGISTGFGALASIPIERAHRQELQHAVVRSHASGMGPAVEREVVRAMLLLRARTLAMGYSGTRPIVAETMVALLNAGVTPLVPEHGSLGASGDLAPLAHVALCLLGEGTALDADGTPIKAREGLARAGTKPLKLKEKEGLALVNGTDGMLGMLVLACEDALALLRGADIAAAMSIEALLGTDRPFDPALHAIRPHPGQQASAGNLARLLARSEIVSSHRHGDPRVQDAYSMRCAPQVAGAARDTLTFAEQVALRELGSAVDNPVVLADGRVESTGNFHGAPLGYACDFLAVAVADVGAMAERRIDRLLDATRSAGLPAFLTPDPGVNSGLMIAQYTAAALVVDNRLLAHPASVDTIPTSGMQEDHVSMGWTAARKLRRSLTNLRAILAAELLCAAHGLSLRAPLRPAPATGAVLNLIRSRVAGPGPDRPLAADLAAVDELVAMGAVQAAAEAVAGRLR